MENFIKSLPSVLIGMMIFVSCGGGSSGGNASGEGLYPVVYQVSTGSYDGVAISYVDENGDTIDLPYADARSEVWTYSFSAAQGTHLAVTAQLLGEIAETIWVVIIVDGQEVAKQPSYTAGATASAEYVIP
jgi:hypothetical protein